MIARIVGLLLLVTVIAGCNKVTAKNYEKITTGMEYGDVVSILGKPDSSSDAVIMKNCVWGNEQRNITVSFIANKVMLTTSKNIK